MGKHHIIATIGSNIITSKASNIIFAQAKTSFFYRPKVKRKYNTLHLAGKEVCKKDEENLVLFEMNIKLLYDRYPKEAFFIADIYFFFPIFSMRKIIGLSTMLASSSNTKFKPTKNMIM